MNRLNSRLAMIAVLACGIAQAESIAIVGGKVHTVGPQGVVENGTVIIREGRIAAVGANLAVPDGMQTIDADGKVVTPGLFVPAVHLGLGEVGLSADPVDSAQSGEMITASFDVADAFNPRATQIGINRIEGVTRAVILPQPANAYLQPVIGHVISGLGSIVHFGDGGDHVDQRGVVLVVSLGAQGSNYAGGSRAMALAKLRQALDEAGRYGDSGAYDRDEYTYSERDLGVMTGVLSQQTPLLVRVNRASDIEVLLRLIEEYGVRAIIYGGAEAWMIAEEIAAAGVPVLLDPTYNLPGDFDRLNARRGSAALLAASGVTVSFVEVGTPSENARNITQLAGNAVADGMPWDDALRAITLAPAEIFGAAESLGSIEVGKKADVVVWPGDPLELTNFPDAVLINGEAIEMISRQTLLRDRYLKPDSDTPPAYRR